jgi:hypothetical protein
MCICSACVLKIEDTNNRMQFNAIKKNLLYVAKIWIWKRMYMRTIVSMMSVLQFRFFFCFIKNIYHIFIWWKWVGQLIGIWKTYTFLHFELFKKIASISGFSEHLFSKFLLFIIFAVFCINLFITFLGFPFIILAFHFSNTKRQFLIGGILWNFCLLGP